MMPVHVRRLLSILIAGVVIAILGAVMFQRWGHWSLDPRTASLADRIDAEKTDVFVSAEKKTTFEQAVERLVTPLMKEGEPSPSIASIPNGKRYECAVIRTGSGYAWVVYVHEADGKPGHHTLVSAQDSSLFLPPRSRSSALSSLPAIRSYVAEGTDTWVYVKPEHLAFGEGIFPELMKHLLKHAEDLLIIWNAPGEGIAIIQGENTHVNGYASNLGVDGGLPLLSLSLGKTEKIMTFLETWDGGGVLQGLRGIIQASVRTWTDRGNIQVFGSEMLTGASGIVVLRQEDEIETVLIGTAESERRKEEWKLALLQKMSGPSVREIVFPKKENVRRDIVMGEETELREIRKTGDWTFSTLGSTGSTILALAEKGRQYGVSTNLQALEAVIEHEEKQGQAPNDAFFRFTIDLGWLRNLQPSRESNLHIEEVDQWLGDFASRLSFDGKPIDSGWLVHWSITRSSSPSLAK